MNQEIKNELVTHVLKIDTQTKKQYSESVCIKMVRNHTSATEI